MPLIKSIRSKNFLRILSVLFLMFILSGCSINFKNSKNNPVLENTSPSETDNATTTEIQNKATTTEIFFDLTLDSDQDGLTDLQELAYRADRLNSDSDRDGFNDGDEVKGGYNPVGTGKNQLITEDCQSLSESQDHCYYELGVEKKDDSICQKIIDRKMKASCIIMIILKKGDSQPCEAIKIDYPDVFKECQIGIAEYLYGDSKQVRNSRDTKTFSDVRQLQTALELYYNDAGRYPEKVAEGSLIASGANTYMAISPQGIKGITAACADNYQYKYTLIRPQDYTLDYCLDSNESFPSLSVGINTASPAGMSKTSNRINSSEPLKSTNLDRDAKVVAEIKQIQTALELYYNDTNQYPEKITTGAALVYGASVYLETIPTETPGITQTCLNAEEYKYTRLNSAKYTLEYCLDGIGDTGKAFGAGLKTASQNGINIK